jgi:ubiquinone/menaquinone biosynthesis C-methylase UbiE
MSRPASEEHRRFEEFYRRKWHGHEGFWEERYPPDQVVYATTVYRRRTEEILRAAGPRPGSVLDLGCGVGDVTFLLSGRARRVVGADVSLENVRRARDNLRRRTVSNGAVVQGGAETLPFRDGAFDLVVLGDVIEHIPDVLGCLSEVRRVLRPGGRLICVTPIRATLRAWGRVDWLAKKVARPRRTPPLASEHPEVFERFLSMREMEAAFRRADLHPIAFRRVCLYPAAETTGAFGALMRGLHGAVGARRFRTIAGITIRAFEALERVRLLNQKQLWVVSR